METKTLDLQTLEHVVAGHAAALRCVTEYQPAGGVGDKVFPPTYEGGKYAMEKRVVEGGEIVDCVLLDSVQSQANRMELVLLEAWRTKDANGKRLIELPVVSVRFDAGRLTKKFVVTSLDAPHRVADAILRDSLLDGVMFRKSRTGKVLDHADVSNATGVFGLNPTALVFGLWDSTGPRGGLGAKFQRALVSEMVGYRAQDGVKTSSRIDPAEIRLGAGTIYERAAKGETTPDWTLDAGLAAKEKSQAKKLGKDGKPSEANHGNVTPGIASGGFTLSAAKQITVLSLATLRRLRFPLNGGPGTQPEIDRAARTVLAALGLLGATLAREQGADLRSRCQLFPTQAFFWELLDKPGEAEHSRFSLTGGEAVALFNAAVDEATKAGLPWENDIALVPSPELVELVARSQVLATHQAQGDE